MGPRHCCHENRPVPCGLPRRWWRQWGRGIAATKMWPASRSMNSANRSVNGAAALLPRKYGRLARAAGVLLASMGPRHCCHENVSIGVNAATLVSGVNGAAALLPRKWLVLYPILFSKTCTTRRERSGAPCTFRRPRGPMPLQVVQTHCAYPMRAVPVFSSPPRRSLRSSRNKNRVISSLPLDHPPQ